MLKRLGMWNRLAIVSAVLFCLIAPSWSVLSANYETTEVRTKGFELCMQRVYASDSDGSITSAFCQETWLGRPDYLYQGWSEWFAFAGISLIFAVIVYLLIYTAVAIAKWVWRGRLVNQPKL